jgi:hypothetical protein
LPKRPHIRFPKCLAVTRLVARRDKDRVRRGLDLDTDGEIYVVNLDGTDLTQVTGGSQSPDWGTHPVTP